MKELFIRLTVRVFRESLSISLCASFAFGFAGWMWDSVVLVPDHCISFHFTLYQRTLSVNIHSPFDVDGTMCNSIESVPGHCHFLYDFNVYDI